MFRNILINNFDSTWQKFNRFSLNLINPPETSCYKTDGAASDAEREQIENGRLVLIIRRSQDEYLLAYRDKDGDYQEHPITDEKIVKTLSNKTINSAQAVLEITPTINTLLIQLNSKTHISTSHGFATNTGFNLVGAAVVYVAGLISLPFIAGSKTLIDWKTRHPKSKDKINLAVEKIRTMEDNDFQTLRSRVTQEYHQSVATSNSSRKIIKELSDNAVINTDQIRQDLMDYLQEPKNNGKKLFCKVMELADRKTEKLADVKFVP